MYVTLNVRHLKCTAESRELAFSACPSAFYLQALNTSAHCTRRGAYAGKFCANGRFSRPVLPLLDRRPPFLVRVELDGGRMLSTSARTTDACTAPLVANTGFQTKGTGTATASYLCRHILTNGWVSELAFPACPSASWLQVPNASARCTRKEAYAVGFSYSRALFLSPISGARG